MATAWWVNQGRTYEQERKGGYVWASTKTKGGVAAEHHVNVDRLAAGDAVVHYANGSIRAISIVLEKGSVHQRPSELPSEAQSQEGYLARLAYHDLATPIPLTELPARPPDAGPFDRTGGVKQGYLFALSPEFGATLYDTFADRWPIAWLPRVKARSVWLFQGNPDQWDIEIEIPRIGVGADDEWTVSRHGADMRPGDVVVLWKSEARVGVYGLAEITGPLTMRPRPEWRPQSTGDGGTETMIPVLGRCAPGVARARPLMVAREPVPARGGHQIQGG